MARPEKRFSVKDILSLQVAPALGCTEPVAIALGSAAAASFLSNREIDSIEIWVDPNIYKNGLAVSIPGTNGLCGLDLAAALGALGGDPELKLEVLEPITDEIVTQARQLVDQGRVKVSLFPETGLHIKTVIKSGDDTAVSEITGMHDNISFLGFNDEIIENHPLLRANTDGGVDENTQLERWLVNQSLEHFLNLIDELDSEDFEFLEQSILLNMRLAEYGLKHGPGLGIGKAIDSLIRKKLLKKDMMLEARMLTSAAADTRMAGVKLPAMSSAGSGNHGLTAVLPICALRNYLECDHQDILKAIGLSHIITAFVKAHTGRLSAVCGCSVAAGAGAACGVAYLLGGTARHMGAAIKNLIMDLAGVVCDGAKLGCAFKLATAAGSATQAALFALQGISANPNEGIIDVTMEKTAENLGTLSTMGMIEADRIILQIMLNKVKH